MEQFISEGSRWYTCQECQQFVSVLRSEWLEVKTPLCFQGHYMAYYPNSTSWQRLTAIYGLLSSLYIGMSPIISFKQYEYIGTIMLELKARE